MTVIKWSVLDPLFLLNNYSNLCGFFFSQSVDVIIIIIARVAYFILYVCFSVFFYLYFVVNLILLLESPAALMIANREQTDRLPASPSLSTHR